MTTPRRVLSSSLVIGLVHLAATAFMTGVIWYVQVVHYPLMAGWPHDQFAAWEALHRGRTSAIVMPAMLIEAVTLLGLFGQARRGVPRWLLGISALLLAGVWTSTLFLQIPCHDLLSRGWDDRVHARLVETNWLRTALWSGRLALAVVIVPMLLSPAASRLPD
jgi:hypothetical protein